MRDSSGVMMKGTENVGILEVDLGVSDGVGRVEEHFSLAIELDGVGQLVDSVSGLDEGEVSDSLCFDSDVFLVHVFYVVDVEKRLEVSQFEPLG